MSDHEFNFDELVESVKEAIDINKGIKNAFSVVQI